MAVKGYGIFIQVAGLLWYSPEIINYGLFILDWSAATPALPLFDVPWVFRVFER